MLVNTLLKGFEKRIGSIIEKAGGELRKSIVEASLSIEAFISNVRVNYVDLLGKTIEDTNRTLQESLSKIESLVVETERITQGVSGDVENIINSSRAGIDSIRSGKPRIYSYSPKAVVGYSSGDDREVRINLVGANLNQREVKLLVSNKECELVTKIGDNLSFLAYRSFFLDPDLDPEDNNLVGFKSTVLELEITYDTLLGGSQKEKFFLGIYTYPRTFASIELSADVRREVPQNPLIEDRTTRDYSVEGTTYRRVTKEIPITIDGASQGWKLVIGSQKFNELSSTRGGDFRGIKNVNDIGFTLVISGGERSPRIGGIRGKIKGNVSYKRIKNQPNLITRENVVVIRRNLAWGEDVSVDLDQGTQAFKLSAKLFDDSLTILTQQSLISNFIKVVYDSVNKTILIKPIRPRELEIV